MNNKVKLETNRPDQPEFAVLLADEKRVRHMCGTAIYAVHHGTGYCYFIFSGWDDMTNVLRMAKATGVEVFAEAVRRHELMGQPCEWTQIRAAMHGR